MEGKVGTDKRDSRSGNNDMKANDVQLILSKADPKTGRIKRKEPALEGNKS